MKMSACPWALTVMPLVAIASIAPPHRTLAASVEPNYTSPLGVEIYNPAESFDTTGTWSLMSRAGPTLYIAGMRGISPSNDSLVELGYPRVRQAFENMQQLAKIAGTDLVRGHGGWTSCVRLVVYVTDMYRWRPLVNQVQQELWGELNVTSAQSVQYPPRTIVEVQRLNDDDIVEVEGTFWLG